jgi:hypothetical protein
VANPDLNPSPIEVLTAAIQEYAEHDPDGCAHEAERLYFALRDAGYEITPVQPVIPARKEATR